MWGHHYFTIYGKCMYMIRLSKGVAMKPPHMQKYEGSWGREQHTGIESLGTYGEHSVCRRGRELEGGDRQRPDFGVGVSAEG